MVRKNAVEYLEKFSDMNKMKYQKSIGALEELKDVIGTLLGLHKKDGNSNGSL